MTAVPKSRHEDAPTTSTITDCYWEYGDNCVFNGRECCWRRPCPLDFGPWGAWRSVVARTAELAAAMDTVTIMYGETTAREIEGWFMQRLEWSEELIGLGRVGWLP